MDSDFAVPQIKYNMSYSSCPGSFYARDEILRITTENAQLKETIYSVISQDCSILAIIFLIVYSFKTENVYFSTS